MSKDVDYVELELLEETAIKKAFEPSGAETIIALIKERTSGVVFDITTEKGRKECRSLAYKVSQAKSAIDKYGKSLTEDYRKKTSEINAERKKIETALDAIRDEIRKPVDDFDKAEREKREQEQAELEKLRAEKAETERKQREERIAQEARENAIRESQEQERKRNEERERLAREEAAKAERDAQRRIREAEEKAEREISEAKQREQERIEQERKEAEAKAAREADISNRERVLRGIENFFQLYGVEADDAKAMAQAIVRGEVDNLKIIF